MQAKSEIQDGSLDFWLSFIEFLDLENMGIAVGIAQLAILHTYWDISLSTCITQYGKPLERNFSTSKYMF